MITIDKGIVTINVDGKSFIDTNILVKNRSVIDKGDYISFPLNSYLGFNTIKKENIVIYTNAFTITILYDECYVETLNGIRVRN